MPIRLVSSLVVLLALPLLALPAVAQQTNIQNQISQHVDQREARISQVSTTPGPDLRAARMAQLHRDIGELSSLSATVQSGLRQLQSGMLVKDLDGNLKKMEKLSKKIRREME